MRAVGSRTDRNDFFKQSTLQLNLYLHYRYLIELISLNNVSTVSASSPDYTIRVCSVSRMTIFHALLHCA